MTLKTLSISLFSMFFLIGAASSSSPNLDFNNFSVLNLQNGESLTVSYVSTGCFHHDSGVIEFTANTVTYENETKPYSITQARQLDNYFRALSLRQGEFGGCTTSKKLGFKITREGLIQNEATLLDDFCMNFVSDTEQNSEPLLSPTSLKYILFEKEEAEQQTLIIDE